MRFIAIICLLFSLQGKAQYYIAAAPNVAFNTPLNDTKNLLGGTIEVGKYFGATAIGINSGWWTYNSKDFYQEVMATFPIYEITMEYDFNYTIPLKDNYSLILSYGAQSAFGGTFASYSLGINKDFKIK